MSHRFFMGLAVAVMFGLTVPGAAVTQATGTIRGLVNDPSGRPVPAARIGLIDEVSAEMRVTLTDTAGRFRFDGVPPDRTFRAVATRFGFQSASRSLCSNRPARLRARRRTNRFSWGRRWSC
jgi:hypothetical protein